MPDWVRAQAQRGGERAALRLPTGTVVTWAALEADAATLAAALAAAGVTRGSRVASVLGNGRTLVALLHACARLRAALVLIDPRLPARDAQALASSVRVALVVGAESTAATARAAAAACRAPCAISGLDGAPAGAEADARRAELARALAGASRDGARDAAPTIDLDAVLTVVFSSGTAGPPKPIALTAGNHLWSALASAALLGATPEDRWIACLPMAHVGGLSIAIRAAVGGACVLLEEGFEPDRVARALRDEGATLASIVPTALARLLVPLSAARAGRLALRALLVGGAGASHELLARARAQGLPAVPTYGLTEAASQVATLAPWQALGGQGFVGQPLLWTRVRIAREDGSSAAPGEDGSIEVAGPTLSPGRLGPEPGAPPAPLVRADGWLATRDRGRLDAAGGLVVLGRSDDVIVTGGENVSPDPVEAAILALGLAAEVGVAAVPDAEWGHAVGAWIVPREGDAPTLEGLRAALRGRLPAHSLPRRLFVVDALPRTALGKVRRRALREAARAGRADAD